MTEDANSPKSLPQSIRYEMAMHPDKQDWTPASHQPLVLDCVRVVGVVPYENQWKEFDAKLRDAKGWYPKRDRPNYVYLEIQRKEEGKDWVDITQKLADLAQKNYAQYKLIPEFVELKHLHPVLSPTAPPFLNVDFRQLLGHPEIEMRQYFKDVGKKAKTDSEGCVAD